MQIPQLTFTRLIAAIAVVVVHFGLSNWPFEIGSINQLACKFTLAVSYFFLLSGFILVIASEKINSSFKGTELNVKNFWIKRVARIFPLYLLSTTIYFIFHFDYNPDISLIWQVQSYVFSLVFLQTWNYPMATDINFPVWSLSVEAFFYFLFPWIYVLLNRFQTKRLVGLSLLGWVVSTVLYKMSIEAGLPYNFTHYFPPFHTMTFVMGIFGGILFLRHQQYLIQKRIVLWALFGFSSVFVIYTASANWKFYSYATDGLLAPYFLLGIYTISISKGMVVELFASKSFVFMGDISYAIYLFQVPILEISLKYLPAFQGKEVKDVFYFYVILLILVSIILHVCIEKPLRNLINRLILR
jgi:peptidoglycan/LPS O-acetylase OafA/YrhL